VLLLLNAHEDSVAFRLPGRDGETWDALLDTGHDGFEGRHYGRGATYPLAGRSLVLLVKPNR
jgi:hypothetical protein